MDIPEIIARLKERGIDQTDIAVRLGTTQPTVSRWVGGSEPGGRLRDGLRDLAREHGIREDGSVEEEAPQTLGSRLRQAREARRLTPTQAAGKLKIQPDQVRAWEADTARPSPNKMFDVAQLYSVELVWLTEGRGVAPDRSAGEATRIIRPGTRPALSIVPAGGPTDQGHNLPVFAAAMGGDGHVIITFDAIDYVRRPPVVENVRDAYGVLIIGESMIPAYEPGDLGIVHPHLPPTRDTNVVLFHTPPVHEAEAIVKRLLTFNDTEWSLRQYNPARDFKELRVDWPVCHRLVAKYDRR